MPVSEDYLNRLSRWVIDEADRIAVENNAVSGWGILADRMGQASGKRITEDTLRSWGSKRIGKEGLRQKSINILAAYRNELPPHTLAWLIGEETATAPPTSKGDVIKWLRDDPDLGELADVLHFGLGKLKQRIGAPTMQNELSRIVNNEIAKTNIDEFSKRALISVRRLQDICNGSACSDTELEKLACVLPYTAEYLGQAQGMGLSNGEFAHK